MSADTSLPRPATFTNPDLPDIAVPRTPDIEAWVDLAIHSDVPWQHSIITNTNTPHTAGLLLHLGPNYGTCLAVAFTQQGTWLYTTFSPGATIYCPRASDGVTSPQAARLVGVQLESDTSMNSWMAHRLNTHNWTRSHAEQDRITRLHGWIEEGHQHILRIRMLEQLAGNHHEEFEFLLNAAQVQRALTQHPSSLL